MMQDEYLMVANLSYVQRKADVTPYEIWMNYQDDATDGFYKFVKENEVKVKAYTDVIEAKDDLRKDTLLQGTNGILSLSFIVILLLCAVGYLIYWILSIRSRELLFGILRAMGMSKKEVFQILLSEQMFCGVLSVITGIGIGAAATILYVPIIQNAYAATDQMLPLELVCQTGDLVKLFGTVIAVLVICITVLLRIVSKSNITGALKLGED
jgi:putative ABC transport system permease protein